MKVFGSWYIHTLCKLVILFLIVVFAWKTPSSIVDLKDLTKPVVSVAVPTVSADALEPHRLLIPAIKVLSPIVGMGLTPEGRMAVPDNYTEIGWYNLGTQPGSRGSAVMGAHVDDGAKTKGVFKNLKNVKVGDDIYVLDQFNNALHYRVTERVMYPYRTTDTAKVFTRNDVSRLNLITCYGTWLPKENTYDRRLVVFAELVQREKVSKN